MTKQTHSLKRYCFSEKGNALVLVITVSIILLVIMIAAVVLLQQQTKLVSGSRRKSEALSVAEAGLDSAIWRLEENETLSEGTFSGYNSQGQYTVEVTKPIAANDYQYRITSTGEYTDTGTKRKIQQEVYYINLSRSIYSYSGTSGGGQVEGNVNIRGPFYTAGDLNLSGNVSIHNLTGTTGNPIMIRGALTISSAAVTIGGDWATSGDGSPMAIFIKGAINTQNNSQLFDLKSRQVPEVTLPDIARTQYLDAAQANDNAVYNGNVVLDATDIQFGGSGGDYKFDFNSSDFKLKTQGVIYIDGNLTIAKTNKDLLYNNGSGTKSTIFVNGKIVISEDVIADTSGGKVYPSSTVLALINEDQTTSDNDSPTVDTYDIKLDKQGTVEAFIYTTGQISTTQKVTVHGTVMCRLLWIEQVPTLMAPDASANDNFPLLFPGRDLAFLTTTNWREVSSQ
ncbi:MAG: hypothetical protein E3J54_04250 [Actinobacteria bacterium]|nr:MAG: hypothetical protein E3J54_04250 [Actinomycetota bacterium]